MFGKLYKKIYIPLMIIAVALIVFIDVFAFAVETTTLKNAYRVMGEKKLERIMNSCRLYISSVEVSTYNLSLDTEIVEELSSPTGKSLTGKLDDTCNYSLKISAVCAYSESGNTFTSSTVTQVPTIEELINDDGIAAFINGNESSYVSFRTHHIANIYNYSLYPEQMGIITCCQKVYKEGEVIGWIFTDILPVNLYSYVSGEGQFDDAVAFITTSDGFFEFNGNGEKRNLLDGKHSGYFEYSAASADGLYSISVFDGKKDFNIRLTVLITVLAAGSVLLLLAVHFTARYTAKSVTARLDRFLNKMNAAVLP